MCHFCAISISCCLIKGSRVWPARSSHSLALARYSSALDVRTDLPVSTLRPLPAEIPAAHRIQVGSSPGPSFAMTGCIGFQPAQLTGENEPGLGGNEKPQLISRFSSCLHGFLFCLSLALAARQHPPAPISSTDTHAKKPGNHSCRVSHRFCARLGEQACSRDHDPRDECGHAGHQQYLVQNSGHRTLPLLRSTTTSRRRWFRRAAGVQHSPSLFERWRAGARFMLLRLSGRRRTFFTAAFAQPTPTVHTPWPALRTLISGTGPLLAARAPRLRWPGADNAPPMKTCEQPPPLADV